MATQRKLAHPPLREALIDIQLPAPLPARFVERLAKRSLPGLEKKQDLKYGEFEIKLGAPPAELKSVEEPFGCRYDSADGSQVAQLRRNGIAYSVLRDYKEWPEIRDAARRVWEFYLEQIQEAVTVGRIAARYINVLDLPPNIELNEYLTSAPHVPKELPQTLENFFQRVVVLFPDGIKAIVTQALEPSIEASRIILDIDVFAQVTVQGESADLWSLVDALRDIKNAVFFSSVTEKTLGRYA